MGSASYDVAGKFPQCKRRYSREGTLVST